MLFYIVFRDGLTLEEALQMAYSDDLDVRNIYIEPPDVNELTDEDSGEEDEGGLVDNLSRNQLKATAQLEIVQNESLEDDEPITLDKHEEMQEEFVAGNNREETVIAQAKKIDYDEIEWIEGDLRMTMKKFPEADYENFKTFTPVEMFELFFDDDMINFFMIETTRYAQFKNHPNPQITQEEMRCFLAILMLSGYNWMPGKKFFWNTDGDLGNQLVIEAMRRDRFLTIWKYFHLANNNNIDQRDKYYKLRPLIEKLQAKFLEHYVPEKELNFDESMVKYFGRHSCKQFIKGKPIRFGYKVWCVNGKSGYLVNFMIYQGKDPKSNDNYNAVFGSSSAPFVTLMNEIPEEKRNLRYSLFCDNLFTSFHLLTHFKQMGYDVTGTIRENRIPKSCPIISKKAMKKKNRGEVASELDKQNGIILVRWVDNNVVTIASTSDGVSPMGSVKRYSKVEKKNINILRPCVIGKYNSSMSGTDLMDENISRYRIGLRSKKWWWCLFTWLLDATLQNAWVLHKRAGNKLTQLQFRREIVKAYLIKYRNPRKPGGRPSSSASSRSFSRISDDIRFDNIGHYLTSVPNNKKINCAGEQCKSIMRTMCIKCGVGLCLKCNLAFHTRF